MTTTKRILLASAIAPLLVAAPLFAFSFYLWVNPGDVPNSEYPLNHVSPLTFASWSVLPLYVGLVLAYIGCSLCLRHFRALTQRSLHLLGLGVSIAVGLWFCCDWESSCKATEALQTFGIQGAICLALFTGISTLWWHLASSHTQGATSNA